MALNTKIDVRLDINKGDDTVELGTASYKINKSYLTTLKNGIADNQANQLYTRVEELPPSSSVDVDLSGALEDVFGNTVTFTKVKAIILKSDATNLDTMTLGGGANAFADWLGSATDTVTLRTGGTFCLIAADNDAYAVTAGTGDILTIGNDSGTENAKFELTIVGVE